MKLEIDAWNNRWTLDGGVGAPRTRWVAAFLHELVARGRRQGALTRDELAQVLVRHGRPARPVLAKQAQRLVDGLRAAFCAGGHGGAFDRRFVCAPNGKTVGPWRWVAQAGDDVVLVGPTGDVAAAGPGVHGLPALAEPPHAPTVIALASEMKQVLALRWDGQHDLAIELLGDASRWRGATPEFAAMRWFRLGELLAARRDYAAANRALVSAEVQLQRAARSARGGIGPMLAVQRLLATYSQQPLARFQHILDDEIDARNPLRRHDADGDSFADARRLNLISLCQRRWLETHRADADAAQWDEHRDALLRFGHAAVFLSLLTEQYERARNFCANLAYARQQLARWETEDRRSDASARDEHLRCAIDWYAVSMSLHWRFDLPDNLAYLYIFLGELWLSGAQARHAFEAAWMRLTWDGERPDAADFYRRACDCARRTGDPRQLAYAALNELRFAAMSENAAMRRRALKLLKSVFDAHPDLFCALRAEGYPVPDDAAPRR